MQLTRFTNYSIRTLIMVACQPPDKLTTITEIAETFSLSRNHVVKIVHRLGQLGYLHTQRGKHGGVRLAIPAELITVGQLIQVMEPGHELMPCHTPECRLQGVCRLMPMLTKAMAQFYTELDRYTLVDIMGSPETVLKLLEPVYES